MGLVEISSVLVDEILGNLDPSTSMGSDCVHPALLKGCRSAICTPLSLIFGKSLQSSTLPKAWKHSLVVPIFKKGTRLDPLNYRPISLPSVPCKILEKIICRELYKYLDDGEVLLDDQFGFRPGRSTEDQLLLM